MLLLTSGANILMDVEVGDLVAPMFSLGYQFAVPDISTSGDYGLARRR